MMDHLNNHIVAMNNFIDFIKNECKLNNGGLVLQQADGIFDLAQPEHLEWVDKLRNFPIRHVTREEALLLGYDELSEWSHEEDELIFSEMGVLFNLGNTRESRFSF